MWRLLLEAEEVGLYIGATPKNCAVVLAACVCLIGAVRAGEVVSVSSEEFRRIWQIAPERMGATAPPLVMQASHLIREYGEIWVDHEFSVGTDGVPSDYVFYAIEPPGVDPNPFRAQTMFFRYKPVEGQSPTGVRVRQRQHYYMPRPALPGEE